MKRTFAIVVLAATLSCAQDEKPTAPRFRFATWTDPMTDAVTTSIETQSRTGEVLMWACVGGTRTRYVGGKPWVILDFKRYLSPDGYGYKVTHRLQPNPAETESWGSIGGGQMAGRAGAHALNFTQMALRSSSTVLLLRVHSRDDEVVTATFDLTGFAEAVKQLPCATAEPRDDDFAELLGQ